MKYTNVLVIIVFMLIIITGCQSPELDTKCKCLENIILNITVDQAKTLILENTDNPNFVILDVRTAVEYNAGHIENAINIDYYATDFQTQLSQLDHTDIYLVYCKSGARSSNAVKIMDDLEFKYVYNLLGGYDGWSSASR